MSKLTSDERDQLPESAFALPGKKYPLPDASHARNALSRASQNASPGLNAKIKAKVKQKYPGIKVSPATPGERVKGRKGIRGKRTAYKR